MPNYNPRSQANSERSYSNQSRRNTRSDYDDDYRSSRNTPQRDQEGRFMSDDDNYRSSRGTRSSRGYEDDRYSSHNSGRGQNRNRDQYGRFESDDEDDYEGGGNGGYRSSRSSRDSYSSGQGRGWYGDSEGHSRAAREGWDEGDDYRSSRSGRGQNRERDNEGRFTSDDDYRSSRGSRSRDDDDDYRSSRSGSSRSSRYESDEDEEDDQDSDNGQRSRGRRGYSSSSHEGEGRGWHGDSAGHAEAGRHSHDNMASSRSSRKTANGSRSDKKAS